MLAKTLFGLEDLLAEELRKLGASNIEKGTRNVSFEGDRGFMYKANLCCRTAIKVLKPISAFNVFTLKKTEVISTLVNLFLEPIFFYVPA